MVDSRLRILQDFCGGRAEAEASFLTEAFVLAKDYQDALHSPFHSPVLLLGRKGTGKSALLKFIELQADKSGIKAPYLKPDNIPLLDGVGSATDTATIKHKAYEALITAVAVKVGSEMRGMLNRKDKKLFDKAIKEGAKSYDTVQACLHTLVNRARSIRTPGLMMIASTPTLVSGAGPGAPLKRPVSSSGTMNTRFGS